MYLAFIAVGPLLILMLSTFASDFMAASTILLSTSCHLKSLRHVIVVVRAFQV